MATPTARDLFFQSATGLGSSSGFYGGNPAPSAQMANPFAPTPFQASFYNKPTQKASPTTDVNGASTQNKPTTTSAGGNNPTSNPLSTFQPTDEWARANYGVGLSDRSEERRVGKECRL